MSGYAKNVETGHGPPWGGVTYKLNQFSVPEKTVVITDANHVNMASWVADLGVPGQYSGRHPGAGLSAATAGA